MKKPIEIINQKKDYINTFKGRLNEMKDIIPIIDYIEEITKWEEEALSNTPEEADEIPTNDLVENLSIEYDHLISTYPLPPKYDQSLTGGTIGLTTSGSPPAIEFISRVGDIGTPDAINYSITFLSSYTSLQEKQNRVEDIRSFIRKFKNNALLARFESCVGSISQYHVINLEKKESVANFIRNLLYGVQGNLFEKARKNPKENMTWEEMSKRLANSDVSRNVLIRQERSFTNLIFRTSEILKDRDLGSATSIDIIWSLTLDHLYILSTSIQI